MSKNGTSMLVNGTKTKVYYPDIKGKLPQKVKSLNWINSSLSSISNEYRIHSYNGMKNQYAVKALNSLSEKLESLKDSFIPSDLIDHDLEKFIENFSEAGLNDELEEILRKDYTALITKVTNRLNSIQLTPTIRMVLSAEPIYKYLLYKVIEGLEVTKTDGVISAVIDNVPKIQEYLNKQITEYIVKDEHLDNANGELVELQKRTKNVDFKYNSSNLKDQIVDLYSQLKSSGGLLNNINDFLDSGIVEIPNGTDREKLIEKMLINLQKLGYQSPTPPIIPNAPQLINPNDDEILPPGIPVNFKWDEIENVNNYQIQISSSDRIDKNKGFDRESDLFEAVAFGPSVQVRLDVGNFYWSVRAVLKSGEITHFSPSNSFEVQGVIPPTPIDHDDLTIIEGIGPVTQDFLYDQGIRTFNDLASLNNKKLDKIMSSADSSIKGKDSSTWILQAKLADEGKFDKLKDWQEKLKGGQL